VPSKRRARQGKDYGRDDHCKKNTNTNDDNGDLLSDQPVDRTYGFPHTGVEAKSEGFNP
jgi:hypothetical protein